MALTNEGGRRRGSRRELEEELRAWCTQNLLGARDHQIEMQSEEGGGEYEETKYKECRVVYTDGSRGDGRAGYGVFVPRSENREEQMRSYRTPGNQEVYNSELRAIRRALILHQKEDLAIGSDSQTSLKVIRRWLCPYTTGRCYREKEGELIRDICLRVAERSRRGLKTILFKVRAHAGIYGNEKADEAAKRGAQMEEKECDREQVRIEIRGEKAYDPRRDLIKEAQRKRSVRLRGKEFEGVRPRPQTYEWDADESTKYQSGTYLTEAQKIRIWKCRTGIYTTYKRLHRMFPEKYPSSVCPVCGKEEETLHHITSVCEAYRDFRTKRHNRALEVIEKGVREARNRGGQREVRKDQEIPKKKSVGQSTGNFRGEDKRWRKQKV